MISLKDVLDRSVKRSPIGRQLEANQVLHAVVGVVQTYLQPVLGKKISARGEYFKQGTAYITVASAVVAQELRIHEPELVQMVHERLSSDGVKMIRIFVGPVD